MRKENLLTDFQELVNYTLFLETKHNQSCKTNSIFVTFDKQTVFWIMHNSLI